MLSFYPFLPELEGGKVTIGHHEFGIGREATRAATVGRGMENITSGLRVRMQGGVRVARSVLRLAVVVLLRARARRLIVDTAALLFVFTVWLCPFLAVRVHRYACLSLGYPNVAPVDRYTCYRYTCYLL